MALAAKLLTELVGTFLFLTVIALSGPIGPLAPLAIGGVLMAMVYMGGHVSGAHYNPAVTFGVFLRRKIGATELVSYGPSSSWAQRWPSASATSSAATLPASIRARRLDHSRHWRSRSSSRWRW
jgi:aquaporin Z